MHLNDHSLRQIDDNYLRSLGTEELRGLSLRLLADLKEAREQLNQGPTNSSRPPSSRAPWARGERAETAGRKGKRGQARFIPIALTKACSRRATRAADANR